MTGDKDNFIHINLNVHKKTAAIEASILQPCDHVGPAVRGGGRASPLLRRLGSLLLTIYITNIQLNY